MWTGFVIGDRGLGASGDTHPPWMMAHATVGDHLLVGTSTIGQIHLERGSPRDDAFAVRSLGPWVAVAVADGVGSRPLSRYGASYVVEALTALLLRPLTSPPKTTKATRKNALSPSASTSLAPPSQIEEVEFKLPLRALGSDIALLADGLEQWKKDELASVKRAHESSASMDFQQAVSLGWWRIDAQAHLAQSEKSSPVQASASDTAEDQTIGESKVQPLPDEPNLVATMRRAFEKTHLGLREHAHSLDVELADLSCTALALLINLETGQGAAGQVGDGAILALTKQGKVRELVNAPDTGDPQSVYTLNRTNFQDYLAIQVVESLPVDPFLAYYVMTDGLSGDLLYSPKPNAVNEWAQKVDRNLRQSASPAQAAAGMLNWLATYQVKGSWDDRTLVVVTKKERENGDSQLASEQPEPAQSTDHP